MEPRENDIHGRAFTMSGADYYLSYHTEEVKGSPHDPPFYQRRVVIRAACIECKAACARLKRYPEQTERERKGMIVRLLVTAIISNPYEAMILSCGLALRFRVNFVCEQWFRNRHFLLFYGKCRCRASRSNPRRRSRTKHRARQRKACERNGEFRRPNNSYK